MTKQPEPCRFHVRSPDGRAIFGFDEREGAVPSGKRMGHAGATVVDTPTAVGPALQASMGC